MPQSCDLYPIFALRYQLFKIKQVHRRGRQVRSAEPLTLARLDQESRLRPIGLFILFQAGR